ncbi:MAG: DUF2235 domain-containing protein [Methylococcales bacterium]
MGKNIVVCCDGTGNEFGLNNTNVVDMYEPVVRDQEQIAYYDPGVGTFSIFGRVLGKKIGVIMGQGFGYGLTENIEDAYVYLMDRYEPGNKLFLFGFSRGAFTVRVLAGMLHKVGLLQKGSNNLIPYATSVYNTHGNSPIAEGFKKTYCHECKPHFIGVWDTVGSLGMWLGRQFFDDRLNKDVTNAYHAMAIDEKRKKFPVSIWDETDLAPGQNVEQVWFAGVHSDIGGWYEERELSNITLIWMLENAEKHGLRLKQGWRDHLKTDPLGALHESRTGLWRIWPPAIRKIPEGAKIHSSVMTRVKAMADYKPPLPTRYIKVE